MKFIFQFFAFVPLLSFATVWQYDGTHAASNEWHAANAGETLIALHGASNGWRFATTERTGKIQTVAFPQGASPFCFSTQATNRVAEVWVVTRCAEPAELTTLFDAPVDVRLVPEWSLATEQLGNRVSYRINGNETETFESSGNFQLVEARFGQPTALHEIYLGNAAASPMWRREWRGEIGEVLFCTKELTTPQRHALWNYLSLKWSLSLAYDTKNVNVVAELDALGVRRGSLFSTILMVR